jgi:hypothetical protein
MSMLVICCKRKDNLDNLPWRWLNNFKCHVNFEYVFLKKYLHDFQYENMARLSMVLAFDFT